MDYKIISISENDGWAYLEINMEYYLVYPPYDYLFNTKVSENDVNKAIGFGFKEINLIFATKNELFNYLESEYAKHIKQGILSISNDAILDKLLSNASERDINYYFDFIEQKLIPNSELKIASKIRNKLAELDTVKNTDELKSRNLLILKALLVNPLVKFPRLIKKSEDNNFLIKMNQYNCEDALVPC